MGRTEEFAKRKQAKTARKRSRADVGAQINAEESQAAKRRRRKGSRRGCEGMCYTLPTLANPFNESELKVKKKPWLNQIVDGNAEGGEIAKPRRRRKKKTAPEDEGGSEDDLDLNDEESGHLENVRNRKDKPNGKHSPSTQTLRDLNGNGRGTDYPLVGGKRRKLAKFEKVFWPAGEEGKAPIAGWRDERLRSVKGMRKAARTVLAEVGLQGEEVTGELREGGAMKLVLECWHGLLRGRDVLAVVPPSLMDASVAGYVAGALPMLRAKLPMEVGKGPTMLIVVPSRERAKQILKACKPLRDAMGLWTVSVHSEASIEHQAFGLKTMAVGIVVGTPERLLELHQRTQSFSLSSVTFLVLDSADEIQRLGLGKHAEMISRKVRADRQGVVVTSALSQPVTDLARLWLHDPVARAVAKAGWT